MVFAAGHVFSSVSKHGPHKSCTLSLNKSLTGRQKPASCGHFPNLALIHAASAGAFPPPRRAQSFQLLSAPHLLTGEVNFTTGGGQTRFCMYCHISPFFGGGGPLVPRVGRLDAQPVSPVAFTRARKVTQLGLKRGWKSES